MATANDIVTDALQMLGVYSPLKPTNPESLITGLNGLKRLISSWQDDGIDMGAVPITVLADNPSIPEGEVSRG